MSRNRFGTGCLEVDNAAYTSPDCISKRGVVDQGMQPRRISVNHIQLKVFEAEYFYINMRTIQDAFIQLNNDLLRGDSPDGHLLRRAFSYNLSAFLSAHRSARYYIVWISNKPGTTAWRKAIDEVPVLKAFRHLRDLDIHDETLNFSSTTTVRAGDPAPMTTDFTLHKTTLEASRRLKAFPDVIAILCSDSIVNLAEQGLETLKAVVKDGFSKGHLTLQQLTY